MNDVIVMKTRKKQCEFIIDKDDHAKISVHSWYLNGRKEKGFYLKSIVGGKHILLHRYILDAKDDEVVDHINGNTLDNRKENLRLCQRIENARNRKINKTSTTGYKGISPCYNGFRARIWDGHKRIHLGVFPNEVEAYHAYCQASVKYHGEFASV